MGDGLRVGKPSRYVTSQLGRISILPSMGWKNEYQLLGSVIIINDNGGSTPTIVIYYYYLYAIWQFHESDWQDMEEVLLCLVRCTGGLTA